MDYVKPSRDFVSVQFFSLIAFRFVLLAEHFFVKVGLDWSQYSVARGARAPPLDLKSMQNSPFLVLLRPIFAPKMKTALPPSGFRSRSCEGLAVIWTSLVEFFGCGADPKLVKTFFLLRSPAFGRKNH